MFKNRLPLLLFIFSFIFFISCSNDSSSDDQPEVEDLTLANKLTTGESAHDILSADDFTTLKVELVYVTGFKPRAETVENLQTFLEDRLNKPGGISIIETEISEGGEAPYSSQEIRDLEDANRVFYNTGNTIALYVFFADGANVNDTQFSKTIGSAYRNTSVVIYEKTVQEFSDETGEPTRVALESTTLLHEICHLLGLVNLGTALQSDHEDPLNSKHCVVEDCLMFFQTEIQGGIFKMKSLTELTPLDSQCLADLVANGGK